MARDNVAWRKLIIPNSWGEKMVGILDDTGSHHVIVLCHGFRSSKEDAVLINLSSTYLKLGLSTFRFDFSGSGESEGEFQYGNYWKDAEDLRSVVTYLRGQKLGVEILVGHSKGGNAVLLYASKYKDVNTIVNISGRFHLERGIKRRLGENYLQVIEKQGSVEIKDRNGNFEYRVTKESLKERLSTDMKAALTSIPDCCRVLTVHGSKDETVSFDEAKEFERLIRNHRLRIVNDADHYFRQHQRVLASIVVDFVEDGLRKSKHDKTKVDFSSTNLYVEDGLRKSKHDKTKVDFSGTNLYPLASRL